jgi:hypothetical protein
MAGNKKIARNKIQLVALISYIEQQYSIIARLCSRYDKASFSIVYSVEA